MRTRARRARGPAAAAASFSCFPQHAHDITTEDFPDRLGLHSFGEKRVGEERETTWIFERLRGDDEAVPIASERGSVFADDVDDMEEMLHDGIEPVTADEARTEDDA